MSEFGFPAPQPEVIEFSVDAVDRAIALIDSAGQRGVLLDANILPRSDKLFMRYLGFMMREIAILIEEDSGVTLAHQIDVANSSADTLYIGMVLGLNVGAQQFGPVVSLFPGVAEVARMIGLKHDSADRGYKERSEIAHTLEQYAGFGLERFGNLDRYRQRAKDEFNPPAESAIYLEQGIGLGLLMYEHATLYRPEQS